MTRFLQLLLLPAAALAVDMGTEIALNATEAALQIDCMEASRTNTTNDLANVGSKCPCPNCPHKGDKSGACCHWTQPGPAPASACETQNWNKKSCTPAFGTWCAAPPPKPKQPVPAV